VPWNRIIDEGYFDEMKYFDIPEFDSSILDGSYAEQCIENAKKDYENTPEHYSSKSGKPTNLFFIEDENKLLDKVVDQFKYKPNNALFLYVRPNDYVAPHTDGKIYKRDTTIIIPLAPDENNYATVDGVPYSSCYAFNTQIKHSLKNNEYERVSIQLQYEEPIYEIKLLHISGELI